MDIPINERALDWYKAKPNVTKISVREILEDAQEQSKDPKTQAQLGKVIDLFCSEDGYFENISVEIESD